MFHQTDRFPIWLIAAACGLSALVTTSADAVAIEDDYVQVFVDGSRPEGHVLVIGGSRGGPVCAGGLCEFRQRAEHEVELCLTPDTFLSEGDWREAKTAFMCSRRSRSQGRLRPGQERGCGQGSE